MNPPKQSWFNRLKSGLKKSSTKLTEGITRIVTHKKLDNAALEELEELLISTDLGLTLSTNLIDKLRKTKFNQEASSEEIRTFLADEITKYLSPVAQTLQPDRSKKPFVVLVVGVNGSGKTTTIAKLGAQLKEQGLQVSFAAGDTFRAAAVEQLSVWGNRLKISVEKRELGADAAGLAYDALEIAKNRGDDVLLIDTAGRLHTNANLMAELQKIQRVLKKVDPKAPHMTLLVLDATIGQNAYSQIETFKSMTDINGLIITKLDGTAKGGVIVGLTEKYSLPIFALGVGEKVEDLRPFKAEDFALNLLALEKLK